MAGTILAVWFKKLLGVNRTGLVWYTGTLTLGSTGAISSSDTPGFTATKVGGQAGRYLIQLRNSGPAGDAVALKLCSVDANVIGDDTAAYTTAKGLKSFVRANAITTNGNFLIQFVRTDTGADAEIEDNRVVLITFSVKNSSASP